MAVDSQGLLPKALYIELGVDAGTWSRWTSYEHEQTIPSGLLARVIDILGTAALNDLRDVLGRRS